MEDGMLIRNQLKLKSMEYLNFFLLFCFLVTLVVFYFMINISTGRNPQLPPGPYPFPIIGNLLQLSNKPHQALAILSKQYGPLMSLKLGSITTIVISSPDMVKEFFKTHDQSFSNRSIPDAMRAVDQGSKSVVWIPAGDHWRRLRRITKEYLISVQHLDATKFLRKKKVQELVDHVDLCCTREMAVDIGGAAFTASLNFLSNLMFSMDLAKQDSESAHEFKDAVSGLLEVAGKPNIADFFPILKLFDPQGLVRQGNVYSKKIMDVFDRIIDQRLQTRSSDGVTSTPNDILDSLLDLYLRDESEFSRDDMRHLFLALFAAGTDTTSSTLEWAMAELIRNTEKMEMAQSEIKLMESNNKNIQESDISQLTYLQAVIKETLRLHPPAPFLVPHQAIHDTKIGDFIVPKNAQILCNVWGMGRDPGIWSNPETFMPERFLDVKTDYRGQDFEYIPFGTGRRMCPGLNIAHRMLHILLSSLIQNYNWKLERNMIAHDMDMDEKFGLTLQRKVPLKAIPIRV